MFGSIYLLSLMLIALFQYGDCPEESVKISGKRDVLRVSSWSELIQVLILPLSSSSS